MKSKDETHWLVQQSELRKDQTGIEFLEFVESWTSRAEQVIDDKDWTPDEAIRQTLVPTESELGRVSSNFLGQMLVVLVSEWFYGDELELGFTPLERRVFEDYVALMVTVAEQRANEDSDPPEGVQVPVEVRT